MDIISVEYQLFLWTADRLTEFNHEYCLNSGQNFAVLFDNAIQKRQFIGKIM